ncbi:hypothetical protein MIND_01432300 [Mycena indigotica]|uniref:Uncharacterized protein n=1 Tax=Mycena indigotica TaxID=2126181 RepID=A0A8H6VSI8_9AGAR|nr:uncharacterized protein MIND_01432300 [Mycena indigotica]KAF7288453.1 hypothetical protein MIND_01432300 [Mycena indigotica]
MTPTTQHPIPPSLRETHDLIQLIRASDRSHHASPATSERKPPGSSGPILAPPLSGPHPISLPLRASWTLPSRMAGVRKLSPTTAMQSTAFFCFATTSQSRLTSDSPPMNSFFLPTPRVIPASTLDLPRENDIAALKPWHIAQKQPWLGGPRLHYVLSGVDALSPSGHELTTMSSNYRRYAPPLAFRAQPHLIL